jgi:hypothetical protein
MDKSVLPVILQQIKHQILDLSKGEFIGLEGISLAFWNINNDGHDMKSIDKLHHMFLAVQFHDKWHKLNVEYATAMGFKSSVSCEFVVYWKA